MPLKAHFDRKTQISSAWDCAKNGVTTYSTQMTLHCTSCVMCSVDTLVATNTNSVSRCVASREACRVASCVDGPSYTHTNSLTHTQTHKANTGDFAFCVDWASAPWIHDALWTLAQKSASGSALFVHFPHQSCQHEGQRLTFRCLFWVLCGFSVTVTSEKHGIHTEFATKIAEVLTLSDTVQFTKGTGSQVEVISTRRQEQHSFYRGLWSCVDDSKDCVLGYWVCVCTWAFTILGYSRCTGMYGRSRTCQCRISWFVKPEVESSFKAASVNCQKQNFPSQCDWLTLRSLSRKVFACRAKLSCKAFYDWRKKLAKLEGR